MAKWQWAALWKRVAKRYRRFDKYLYKSLIRTRIRHQDTRYWARVWKRAAKLNRWLYRYARDMLWRWKLKYWEKFKWARAWKAAAKKWRKEAFHAQYLLSLREEAYD